MTSSPCDVDDDDVATTAAVTAVAWQRPMTSHDAASYRMSVICIRCNACRESSLYHQMHCSLEAVNKLNI